MLHLPYIVTFKTAGSYFNAALLSLAGLSLTSMGSLYCHADENQQSIAVSGTASQVGFLPTMMGLLLPISFLAPLPFHSRGIRHGCKIAAALTAPCVAM